MRLMFSLRKLPLNYVTPSELEHLSIVLACLYEYYTYTAFAAAAGLAKC